MKKEVCFVLVLVLFVTVPGWVSAEGGLGAWSGLGGVGSQRVGLSCDPVCPPALTFDVGYLFCGPGIKVGETFNDSFLNYDVLNYHWTLQGVQVGATFRAPLKGKLGLLARGTWLIPSNRTGTLTFHSPSGLVAATDGWSTKTQYWTVDGAAVYPFSGPCSVLAGFRYDSLSTDFRSPSSNALIFNIPSDNANWAINEYIPYGGIDLTLGRGGNGQVRVWAIGTPWLWGRGTSLLAFAGPNSVKFNPSFKRGYFGELGAEYGVNVRGGTFSVLAKWTGLHNNADNQTITNREAGVGVNLTDHPSVDVTRQNWLLAGQFSLPFMMPSSLYRR